jgi:signal transduction histidine kinase/HAMP domain-containing protein
MRWWLALVFAGIAALTALAVAQVFRASSESAIRERAGELAAGTAVAAAAQIGRETSAQGITRAAGEFAARRRVAVFVLDDTGALITPEQSLRVAFDDVPNRDDLVEAGLDRRRLVEPIDAGRRYTVALPLRSPEGGVLVAVVERPDLEDALGIVQSEILSAALWATLIGALAGLVVATLITRRVRRIASAAEQIESGHFDVDLRSAFSDEIGRLAETIGSMGARLSASFDQLSSDRDRLGRLLEQLQEGVVAVSPALTIEFANSRARLLLGQDLVPGSPLPDPWQAPSLTATAHDLFEPGTRPSVERIHPDAGHTYLLAGIPPAAGGQSAVLVITDATERERRARAEREFVTNAAHELRTPITAISSAVEVLQHGAKDVPTERDRFLGIVERQAERLGGLVHALLTLARAQTRAETVQLEPIAVRSLLEDVVRDGQLEPTEIEIEADDVAVLGHRSLLRQALGNLLVNAVSHGGGKAVRLAAYPVDDGHVRLEVSDRGPGMTKAEAERVFDRFYRTTETRAEGFGLGLAIVDEAVGAMGGSVSVETSPETGTTIGIVLAAAPGSAVP